MKAKFIYEKFTQDTDPIRDLGIGVPKKLKSNYTRATRLTGVNDVERKIIEDFFKSDVSDQYFLGSEFNTSSKERKNLNFLKKLLDKEKIIYKKTCKSYRGNIPTTSYFSGYVTKYGKILVLKTHSSMTNYYIGEADIAIKLWYKNGEFDF